MRTLFKLLGETLESGRDAAIVTVAASSGSTPRGAGASMLVTDRGRIYGTIGGGAVEYRGEQLASEALKSGSSLVRRFELNKNDVADLGMICGGDVELYIRYISAAEPAAVALVSRVERLFSSGEEFWLILDITGGGMAVYGLKSGFFGDEMPHELAETLGREPDRISLGGHTYYREQLFKPGRVFIFGGGHVAQALVPALVAVGFPCTVIEDRPEFAKPELFPGVSDTRVIGTDDLSALLPEITADDYVCVMTRGHKDDYTVQRQVLRTPARYIGVIGSRRKAAAVFERLRGDGFTEAELNRVTSPIGIDIAAETPAEIAVSIAAQLIMERAGKGGAAK